MSTDKERPRLSVNANLSEVARSTCEGLDRLLSAKNGIGERDQTKLPESNRNGSHPYSQTSLSDQEKTCIAMLSNGLVGLSQEGVKANVDIPQQKGSKLVQLNRSRAAKIRDKNRRAQQKYRERKKLHVARMIEELESNKKQIAFLQAENMKLVGVRHALSQSCALRKALVAEHKIRKEGVNNTASDGVIHECTDGGRGLVSPSLEDVFESIQKIRDAKKILMASENLNMSKFQEKILAEFWKFSSADSAAFVHLMVCGTVLADECEESSIAFKELVLSMIQNRNLRDLTEAVDILDRLSNDFDKVIFRAQYIGSKMLYSPRSFSMLSLSSHLQGISHFSDTYTKEYASLFKVLEKVFSPEQYARLWLESPTVAVPDALQILHWISESIQDGVLD